MIDSLSSISCFSIMSRCVVLDFAFSPCPSEIFVILKIGIDLRWNAVCLNKRINVLYMYLAIGLRIRKIYQ